MDDVLVIEEDVVPRHKWRLGVAEELLKGSDGHVRGAKVKVGKTKNTIHRLVVNRLYPTEKRWSDPRNKIYHTKKTLLMTK